MYIKIDDTVRSFAAIVDGEVDDLPEQAFRYAGTIDDVRERAQKMSAEQSESGKMAETEEKK